MVVYCVFLYIGTLSTLLSWSRIDRCWNFDDGYYRFQHEKENRIREYRDSAWGNFPCDRPILPYQDERLSPCLKHNHYCRDIFVILRVTTCS